MKPPHQFQIGDRVQLSKLGGSRSMKMKSHVGTVVSIRGRRGRGSVYVLIDGNKEPSALHHSYIEPELK